VRCIGIPVLVLIPRARDEYQGRQQHQDLVRAASAPRGLADFSHLTPELRFYHTNSTATALTFGGGDAIPR